MRRPTPSYSDYLMASEEFDFKHDDFEVVRVVDLFGGYEELKHKNEQIAAVRYPLTFKSSTASSVTLHFIAHKVLS